MTYPTMFLILLVQVPPPKNDSKIENTKKVAKYFSKDTLNHLRCIYLFRFNGPVKILVVHHRKNSSKRGNQQQDSRDSEGPNNRKNSSFFAAGGGLAQNCAQFATTQPRKRSNWASFEGKFCSCFL